MHRLNAVTLGRRAVFLKDRLSQEYHSLIIRERICAALRTEAPHTRAALGSSSVSLTDLGLHST